MQDNLINTSDSNDYPCGCKFCVAIQGPAGPQGEPGPAGASGAAPIIVKRLDLSASGSVGEITIDNVIYRLSYGSSSGISASIGPVSDTVVIDMKRATQYDGGSIEGSTYNNYSLASFQTFDSLIYTDSREMHRIWIRQQDPETTLWSLHEIKTFSSNGGARTTVWVYLVESGVSYS